MYRVDIEVFEGPLDLLIYLIRKKDVSIYDIPISEITEEFLNYIETMKELNIPLASEFIVMAATLAKIKSEMLIPRDDDYDPRKAIVQAIEEYLKIKKGVKKLEELENIQAEKFSNNPADIVFQFQDKIKIDNTVEDLKNALISLLERKEEKPPIGISLNSEKFKVSVKIEYLRKVLNKKDVILFSELSEKASCKLEVIVYFLAILELCKMGEAAVCQQGEEIVVSKVCKLFTNNLLLTLESENPVKVGNPI
ncbi:segregation and condensation protein A [Desulfurobacterium atlanticum]|uniref:Segregation and condensation protein A n=1 Tax=Desulfurobacterium atlanticum TaxID=240169 RepID=A0A238ZGE1_9BACT|nr:segregation/condensation protein A [Desulfurobacterium atlanticum]SNR82189.1 condensin subunit ScpA [Desulfurobacterium atlanticum]